MVVMNMHKKVKARQWIDGIVGDDGVRFRAMRLSPGRSPSLSCSLVYSLCRKGVCYGAGRTICDPVYILCEAERGIQASFGLANARLLYGEKRRKKTTVPLAGGLDER